MKRFIVLIPALALSACGTTKPVTPVKTVTVQVPVEVPCRIPTIKRPVYATERLGSGSDRFDKVKAALVELEQRKSYEARLEAAAKACNW